MSEGRTAGPVGRVLRLLMGTALTIHAAQHMSLPRKPAVRRPSLGWPKIQSDRANVLPHNTMRSECASPGSSRFRARRKASRAGQEDNDAR